jgi:hypothetical protein
LNNSSIMGPAILAASLLLTGCSLSRDKNTPPPLARDCIPPLPPSEDRIPPLSRDCIPPPSLSENTDHYYWQWPAYESESSRHHHRNSPGSASVVRPAPSPPPPVSPSLGQKLLNALGFRPSAGSPSSWNSGSSSSAPVSQPASSAPVSQPASSPPPPVSSSQSQGMLNNLGFRPNH